MGIFSAIALPVIGIVLLSILGHCEMSIYPGLRRKPLQQQQQQSLQQQQQQLSFDMSSDFLSQLMEENARRRLQQQFEQQLELIKMQMDRQRQRQERERARERFRERERERYRLQQMQELQDNEDDYGNSNNNNNNNQYQDQYETSNVEFTYKYPPVNYMETGKYERRPPFAIGPADPRYYEVNSYQNVNDNEEGIDGDIGSAGDDDDVTIDSQVLDDYEEYVPAESKQIAEKLPTEVNEVSNNKLANSVLAPAPVDSSKLLDTSATANFHRIKPQTVAAVGAAGVNVIKATQGGGNVVGSVPTNGGHDIAALIDKLQKEGKSGHDVSLHTDDQHIVLRQHLGMSGEMGMYIVALIAGISAAVTVGVIALGIAWLHNRTKAAADVEYPAYGVTGPNKDISPSGDRKLAQSAQMYHYQHQKQQIIAMENRQAAEGGCGLSDVESDDDNDEGDYTVYECPGLAPTGEMEVKNPLFLDETPLTPSTNAAGTGTATTPTTNITQATPQQPQVIKKSTGKAASAAAPTSLNLSSEEKTKKKNKK